MEWARENLDLKRWFTHLSRGSPITAEVYVRRLHRVCELLHTSPDGLLEKGKSDLKSLQDDLEDMVTALEIEKKSPGYIIGLLKSTRSLLRYNDITLTRKIKVSSPNATPTIADEEIPSKEELSRIFRTSSSRARVAEALIAFADLRPHSLGNHDGSDGLMLKDFSELQIDDGEVVFDKVPTMVVVRSNPSKARNKYFTFLSKEGCMYLQEYLEERIRKGEKLTNKSPIITYERSSPNRKFLTTRKITRMIRESMRSAGVRKRPYVLRAYAKTQLIIAESKGKISHPYLQFIAGHKGDIESRYSTNKGVLTQEMVRGIREAYKACEFFLSTVAQPLEQNALVKEAKVEALKSIAKSLLGLDLMKVKIAKEKDLQRELEKDEEIVLFENAIRKSREPEDDPQIIIEENDLESYLKDGWEYVSTLPSQKILIRK
jgi:hypothetical protein